MATWQTPKTDWSQEDGVLDQDLNRMEGNIQFLYENRALQAKNVIKYFVSASGSDTNDGLTSSTPFKTIQKAIDMLPKDLSGYSAAIDLTDDYHAGFTASGFHGGSLTFTGASNASVGFTSDINIVDCSSVGFSNLSYVSLQGMLRVSKTHCFISNISFTVNNTGGHAVVIQQSNAVFVDSLQATSAASSTALFAEYNSNVFIESFLAMPGSGTGIQSTRGAKVAYSNSSNRASVEVFTMHGGRVLSAAQNNAPQY